MIDWSKLKPREILEIIFSAPRVATPWRYTRKPSGIETLRRVLIEGNGKAASAIVIQRWERNMGPKWWTQWGSADIQTTEGDVESAQAMGDALLLKAGYVLDNDLPCNVEDGVTEWCRGCGRLKREHQSYPKDPPWVPSWRES